MKADTLATKGKRICLLSIALMLFALSSFAQKVSEDSFQRLTIDGGKISFVVPNELLVHNETQRSRVLIHGNVNGVSVSVNARKTGNGLRWMKDALERDESDETESEESRNLVKSEAFKVGDYYLRTVTQTKKEEFYLFLESASASKYLTIAIRAKDADNPMIQRILASISFDGKAVFNKITATALTASASVSLFDLKTSELVKSALNRKQNGKIVVKVDENAKSPKSSGVVFSRPLIILSKPFARYTEIARSRDLSGTVKLLVQFKADGDIGEIIVANELGLGLSGSAIDAAKKIKFLPALVDGKEVDLVRTIIYTFATY